jgi:hypothetical protein
MDIATIDQQYQQLETQAQQTATHLTTLGNKLQTAAQAGNTDAREWLLDLREVALAMQAEQNQVGMLLQALHDFVVNQAQQAQASAPAQSSPWAQQPAPQPGYPAAGYPQQPAYPPQGYAQPQQQGGLLGSFMGSGFGRAIVTGAGFGIGDDLINSIFR